MPGGSAIERMGETSAAGASGPVRVLVVDDSAFMRKMLTQIVATGPGIEVVGTARDGEDALEKLDTLRPDVITLDVEMPHMDGITFLERLMQKRPLPVVMISSLTAEGAEVTLACLQRGAVDFVLKPSGSISLNIATVGEEIVAKVRSAARARVQPPSALSLSRSLRPVSLPGSAAHPQPTPGASQARHDKLPGKSAPLSATPLRGSEASATAAHTPVHSAGAVSGNGGPERMDRDTIVVAIASSTGGPAALQEVLPRLPADLNAAYLVVQHLPPSFTRSLATRLDHASGLTVREAEAGDVPQRGLVLIAPGGHHLELDAKGRIALNDDPPLWGVRPAADVMMRAVAAHYGKHALGVVLTGMGCDGALGVKAIHAAGGLCLAQDEATCVVYGMPRAAAETGALAQVVPLTDMAAAIARQIVARGRAA